MRRKGVAGSSSRRPGKGEISGRALPVYPRRGGHALILLLFAIWPMIAQGGTRPLSDRATMADMKHVGWSMENGAPSRIGALGQSRDGYLWIGSVEGLFRFDGRGFEQIRPERPRAGPFVVSAILGARNGDLWVGLARSGGVALYRGGRLIDAAMPNPSREVTGIAETPDGAIWVARGGRNTQTLARYFKGRWQEIGRDWGLPDLRIWQLYVSRDGTLWAVVGGTIVRLPAGAHRFADTGVIVMWRASIASDGAGRMWVSDGDGPRPLQQATHARTYPSSGRPPESVLSTKIAFDPAGRLWGTTVTSGLFRIDAPGAVPHRPKGFGVADGLTSDHARSIFVDREGNLWVGTELGLDMLRPASVTVEPAIPPNSPESYHIAAVDGTVYITDIDTLYRVRPRGPVEIVQHFTAIPSAMCAGRDKTLWITFRDHALRFSSKGVERFAKPVSSTYYGCAEDAAGRLWLPAADDGLMWRDAQSWKTWPGLRPGVGVPGDAAILPDGAAAILFRTKPPVFPAAPFMALSSAGLGVGNVEGLLPTSSRLIVSGANGMAAVVGSEVRMLDARRYPWLASVNGLVETPAGDIWTVGDAGIVRMRSAALDAAFARPGAPLPHRVYDFNDGVNSFAQKGAGMQVAAGADGRVWFLTRRNVLTIDPARLTHNLLPPSVLIRAVRASGTQYRDPVALTLRAGTTGVSIDFTATSLVVPSRVRFRYRLEGVDKDWVEASSRRSADYADLGPGTYRFRVIASNNDGVWNDQGAALTFRIPPTFVQTWPFRVAALIGFGLLLWLLYSLRLRQVAQRINERFEARSAERDRIARELHDTLLQGVQGLIMRVHAIAERLPHDDPTRSAIDKTLDRAEDLMVEGRNRVHDLRTPGRQKLADLLATLVASQPFDPAVSVVCETSGTPRSIYGPIVDEIGQIAREALFNAARHAQARRVVVHTLYARRTVRVSITDDGIGIDPDRAAAAGRTGHYGLIGMRERALRIGATLSVTGGVGGGTAITLEIPAAIAYEPALPLGFSVRYGLRAVTRSVTRGWRRFWPVR